jgi:hypothetical protein
MDHMDEAAIWRERYFALHRWVKKIHPYLLIPSADIEEASKADWEDFWKSFEKGEDHDV